MAGLPIGFPTPLPFTPFDATNLSNLDSALRWARARYNLIVFSAHQERWLWALKNSETFAGEAAEFVHRVEMDPAYAPLYKPYHIDHEPVFNKGPVLFLYGSKDRIMTMVNKPGLRVSGGAPPHADPSQQGVFPQGVYGTEVPPYAKDITQGVLSRLFFTNKWALPGISRAGEPVREGADVTHFVMFAPNMEWTSPGFIQYERAQAPFTKVLHWVKKSNMDPGALVGYDIIAYGKSQIPISASDMDVTIRQEEGELVMSGLTHSLEASGVASVFDPRAVHSAPSDFAPASPKSD